MNASQPAPAMAGLVSIDAVGRARRHMCLLCKRKFPTKSAMRRHGRNSAMHRANVDKAHGGLAAVEEPPHAKDAPAAVGAEMTTEKTRATVRAEDELSLPTEPLTSTPADGITSAGAFKTEEEVSAPVVRCDEKARDKAETEEVALAQEERVAGLANTKRLCTIDLRRTSEESLCLVKQQAAEEAIGVSGDIGTPRNAVELTAPDLSFKDDKATEKEENCQRILTEDSRENALGDAGDPTKGLPIAGTNQEEGQNDTSNAIPGADWGVILERALLNNEEIEFAFPDEDDDLSEGRKRDEGSECVHSGSTISSERNDLHGAMNPLPGPLPTYEPSRSPAVVASNLGAVPKVAVPMVTAVTDATTRAINSTPSVIARRLQIQGTALCSTARGSEITQLDTGRNVSAEGIANLSPNDVTITEGTTWFSNKSNPGNERYRELINQHKIRYAQSNRQQKEKISEELVKIWCAQTPPGRFVGCKLLSKYDNKWYDVGDAEGRRQTTNCFAWLMRFGDSNKFTRKKPPGMPKRPDTAYVVYYRLEKRKQSALLRGSGEDANATSSKVSMRSTDVAARWSELAKEDRAPYDKEAAVDLERYLIELAAWRPRQEEEGKGNKYRDREKQVSTTVLDGAEQKAGVAEDNDGCKRIEKPRGIPKKPSYAHAYNIFLHHEARKRTALLRGGSDDANAIAKFSMKSVDVATRWNNLTKEDRAPYDEEAAVRNRLYSKELAEWHAKEAVVRREEAAVRRRRYLKELTEWCPRQEEEGKGNTGKNHEKQVSATVLGGAEQKAGVAEDEDRCRRSGVLLVEGNEITAVTAAGQKRHQRSDERDEGCTAGGNSNHCGGTTVGCRCANYDQCHECVSNPDTPRHPHQLKGIAAATGKQHELTEQQCKERQRSHQVSVTHLLHAVTCFSPTCSSANCAKTKELLKHGASCRINATGGCHDCKCAWALLWAHARQCGKQTKCPVPHCAAIRERFRQLTRQQQATDDRTRQDMTCGVAVIVNDVDNNAAPRFSTESSETVDTEAGIAAAAGAVVTTKVLPVVAHLATTPALSNYFIAAEEVARMSQHRPNATLATSCAVLLFHRTVGPGWIDLTSRMNSLHLACLLCPQGLIISTILRHDPNLAKDYVQASTSVMSKSKYGPSKEQARLSMRLISESIAKDASVSKDIHEALAGAKQSKFILSHPLHILLHNNGVGKLVDTDNVADILSLSMPDVLVTRDRSGATPLVVALQNRVGANIVRYLVTKGGGEAAAVVGGGGNYPLHLACSAQVYSFVVIKLLYDAYPEAAEKMNDDGRTPADIVGVSLWDKSVVGY